MKGEAGGEAFFSHSAAEKAGAGAVEKVGAAAKREVAGGCFGDGVTVI